MSQSTDEMHSRSSSTHKNNCTNRRDSRYRYTLVVFSLVLYIFLTISLVKKSRPAPSFDISIAFY